MRLSLLFPRYSRSPSDAFYPTYPCPPPPPLSYQTVLSFCLRLPGKAQRILVSLQPRKLTESRAPLDKTAWLWTMAPSFPRWKGASPELTATRCVRWLQKPEWGDEEGACWRTGCLPFTDPCHFPAAATPSTEGLRDGDRRVSLECVGEMPPGFSIKPREPPSAFQ